MIARAFHSAGRAPDAGDTELPEADGVDLDSSVLRIADWGGDPIWYSALLAAALAKDAQRTATSTRGLGVIAGWRAGVVALREEALIQAAANEEDAVAAALNLQPAELKAFLVAQSSDPFAWPSPTRLVARVGGFSGFGGAWVAPPTQPNFVAATVVEVTCGREHWAIHVDVFGSQVVRIEKRSKPTKSKLTAVVRPNSYLVDIERPWIP